MHRTLRYFNYETTYSNMSSCHVETVKCEFKNEESLPSRSLLVSDAASLKNSHAVLAASSVTDPQTAGSEKNRSDVEKTRGSDFGHSLASGDTTSHHITPDCKFSFCLSNLCTKS